MRHCPRIDRIHHVQAAHSFQLIPQVSQHELYHSFGFGALVFGFGAGTQGDDQRCGKD